MCNSINVKLLIEEIFDWEKNKNKRKGGLFFDPP